MKDLLSKPIERLEESDLEMLKTRPVPEGLFIDYKIDFTNDLVKKLPRLVASFANTHGGWIIIGADARNADNVPTDFPGFDLTGPNQHPKERFRDICLNIDPVPLFFYTKLIFKPGGQKGILVAYIEESPSPPHITLDGRIYRRNAEGSDPVHETNRQAIDLLYQKAEASSNLLEVELTKANLTQDYFGYTLLVHPEPVRILIPDLFVRHNSTCKGDYLLSLTNFGSYQQLYFGQDWVACGRLHEKRINKKGCISFSYFLNEAPIKEHRPAEIPPINEENEINVRLSNLLKLAHAVYHQIDYKGNCRIVLYFNGMRGVGLKSDGIEDKHVSKEDSLMIPLQPLTIRADKLEQTIQEHIKALMLEIYHSFGHGIYEEP